VAELVAQHLERHAVLQGERHCGGKTIHKAGYRRPFLRRGDEHFPRAPVVVKPDRQIPFVPAHIEVMDYRFTLVRQAPSDGLRATASSISGIETSQPTPFRANIGVLSLWKLESPVIVAERLPWPGYPCSGPAVDDLPLESLRAHFSPAVSKAISMALDPAPRIELEPLQPYLRVT